MNYHLTPVSKNVKTGPIPVSTSSAGTCASDCPLAQDGCYAKGGHVRMHWDKVTAGKRGGTFDEFVSKVRGLPEGQLWRHNQAGDLPGPGLIVNQRQLADLVDANNGKRGFTYTHKYNLVANLPAIKAANDNGFTVNLSANGPAHADQLADLQVGPVATVIPNKTHRKTPAGRPIAICPAQLSEKTTCSTCGLCQRADRPFIIGFLPEGLQPSKAQAVAESNS